MAREHAPRRRLSAVERREYHGYGFEASLDMLKENLWHAERVELFPSERIAFLDIRFGELFHRCSDREWSEFLQFLSDQGVFVKNSRWWEWWRR